MQALNGLGDNTDYFIELSHQDDSHHDRFTQGIRNYNQKHGFQHNAEHLASHPNAQETK